MARRCALPPGAPRLAAILALVLAVALSTVGCGYLGGDTRPRKRAPVVTQRMLDRYPESSPAHAFLEWFQALQKHEVRRMARYYVPSLGLTVAELRQKRKAGAYAVDPLAPPFIRGVAKRGSRAAVIVRFRTGWLAPNGRVDYVNKNVSRFDLRREHGRWLLASDSFLDLVAREPSAATTPHAPLVSRRQIARYPANGPERAFLEWFQALQKSRTAVASRYYAPALRLTPAKLRTQRRDAAYAFQGLGPPRIVGSSRNGPVVTISVAMRNYSVGNGAFKERDPIPFELRREGGRWLLTSNGLLELLASRGSGG